MALFSELGLSAATLDVLKRKGFEAPTPIQALSIPAILKGEKDIVAQAQTGTGKTAAFGLPILERIKEGARHVQALVLAPTRELAIQVAEEINSLKGSRKLSVIPIYGGQSMDLQLKHLKRGVDIVVGTPGRVLDHLRRKTLRLENISFLVLDEADEMLNMGFLEDVQMIIETTSQEKQTLLFSATMPQEIQQIAKRYMKGYDLITVTQGQLTASQTDQIYFEVSTADKFEALCRILDIEEAFYGVVFCSTKVDVDRISARLMERGYDAEALHGDMTQNLREKILTKFKKKLITVLVATDVAARGIDVQNLTHVINYALPHDPESYVHRIGRTGRAGKEGNAITFITPSEYRQLQFIQKRVKTQIRKEALPSIRDVIETKKQKIKNSLDTVLAAPLNPEYVTMAKELLKNRSADEVVPALLQQCFQEQLNESKYVEIEDASVDHKGKTRLFVRGGNKDGLTAKKLAELITEVCGIENSKIRDIQILERFSFVNLPFHEAEQVLEYFKKRDKNGEPFVTKAKKESTQHHGDRGHRSARRDRGGDRGYRGDRGGRGDRGYRGGHKRF